MSGPDNQEVARACIFLFEKWTREEKIPKEDFPNLATADFLAWVRERQPNPFEVMAQMQGECSTASIEFLYQVAQDPTGPARIMSMWPFMIMSARGNEHKIRSFQFLTVLTYEDDVVAPLSIFAHKDVIEGEIDDAAVISFMQDKVPNHTQRIMQEGLDSIHETYAPDKLPPIEATLNEIVEFLDAHATRHLLPEQVEKMKTTLTFLVSMFPQEVPEDMKRQLKEIGQKQADSESGWDVPG
jgi:hypothetical protein